MLDYSPVKHLNVRHVKLWSTVADQVKEILLEENGTAVLLDARLLFEHSGVTYAKSLPSRLNCFSLKKRQVQTDLHKLRVKEVKVLLLVDFLHAQDLPTKIQLQVK